MSQRNCLWVVSILIFYHICMKKAACGHFLIHPYCVSQFWQLVSFKFPAFGVPLRGSDGKESACRTGDWVLCLVWEDPLQRGMATQYSISAWRIPWTEEPGRLQSMGLQRVGHDWATKHTHCHPMRARSCFIPSLSGSWRAVWNLSSYVQVALPAQTFLVLLGLIHSGPGIYQWTMQTPFLLSRSLHYAPIHAVSHLPVRMVVSQKNNISIMVRKTR